MAKQASRKFTEDVVEKRTSWEEPREESENGGSGNTQEDHPDWEQQAAAQRNSEDIVGFGSMLRQAREKQHISIEEVAERLYLDPGMVEAIETENHKRLPEPIFVQGYLRNYTKLLNLDSAPIIRGYYESGNYPVPAEFSDSNLERFSVNNKKRSSVSPTVFIIPLLVLLAALWLWQNPQSIQDFFKSAEDSTEPAGTAGNIEENPDNAPELSENNLTTPLETGSPNETFTPPSDTASVEEIQAAHAEAVEERNMEAVGENTDATTAALDGEISDNAGNSGPAGNVAAPAEVTENAMPPAVVAEEDAASTAGDSKNILLIKASGDCWLEVRDKTGKALFVGTLIKPESKMFKGKPPYKLVIGRPQDIQLEYQGKAVDLKPYHGRIARIAVGG